MQDSELVEFARLLHRRPLLGASEYRERGKLLLKFFQPDAMGQVQCMVNIGQLANFFFRGTPAYKEESKCPKGCEFYSVINKAIIPAPKDVLISREADQMLSNYLIDSSTKRCPSCDALVIETTYEVGKNYFHFLLASDLNRIAENLLEFF